MSNCSYFGASFRYNPVPAVIFNYSESITIIKNAGDAYATALHRTADDLIGMDLFMNQDKSFLIDCVESFARFKSLLFWLQDHEYQINPT